MKIKKRILSLALAGTMALGLMPGMSMTALAADGDTSYTLTIPSTLNVANSGWNATDGISATGTLASGYTLNVTAASANSWALKSGDNSVGYNLATATGTYSNSATPASWKFTELTNEATTQPMGIIVDDYSTQPAGTYQDTVTFTAKVNWDGVLSTLTQSATATDGTTITGTLGTNVKVSIADGATVTLEDATINGTNNESYSWAGITCLGDATIILKGTNTVKGFFERYPGIYVPRGKTVTIKGEGSLTASSNGYGAGIGAGQEIACGNIVISGGIINATGSYAAGIGGAYKANCGDILINGGTINVRGGMTAAGIGGGRYAACGSITITDGVTRVKVTKGNPANYSIGAGNGNGASVGTVTIGGTVGAIGNSPYTYAPQH